MVLNDLIERGYFPKELPPTFNTKVFARHLDEILHKWDTIFQNNMDASSPGFVVPRGADFKQRKTTHIKEFTKKYGSSKCCIYSISKGKLSRRFLQIPNPKHFALLARKIVDNWHIFENVYALSIYSKSFPVPEDTSLSRAVRTHSKSVLEFKESLIQTSFDKKIEVRIDISKFYPTIYTHTIPWALLGKDLSKIYYKHGKEVLQTLVNNGDNNAILYKTADSIDEALRNCQDRQSIGIPIGPDTSLILAEAIACRIDHLLQNKFGSDIKACRYHDDFYIYVSSKDKADQVLKGLQLILSDFQLEINESKIKIREFPFRFEEDFITALFLFQFKDTNLSNGLRQYFSLIWDFADKNTEKTHQIFKYALRTFERKTTLITKYSWKTFESLLLKTILADPSILNTATKILLDYKHFLDQESIGRLKGLLNNIINDQVLVNHNFEVSWALWTAKALEIEIEEITANKIIETKDCIGNLILLDLINNTSLVKGTPDIGNLESDLKDDVLFSENWLLAYEGVKKGWLTPHFSSLLDDNLFFKLLKDLNIEFYDTQKMSFASHSVQSKKLLSKVSIEQMNLMKEKISRSRTDIKYLLIENLENLIDIGPSGEN